MKVNNIQSYNANFSNVGHASNKASFDKKNSPSFGGALSVNFWDAVARGGFAASFTVQDMTGTNIPRTYQALQRNKEITGENNYKAAAEVAIREFLTGPSMCIIPIGVLALAKKFGGSANEVPLDNIASFSDEMKKILEHTDVGRLDPTMPKNYPVEYSNRIKMEFYERMFALALGEDLSDGKKVSKTAEELATMLHDYDIAPKRNPIMQLLNKNIKRKVESGSVHVKGQTIKAKDQIFDQILSKYTDAKKLKVDDYASLLSTDMNGTLKKQNSIRSLIKDFSNFGRDVQETIQKHATRNGSATSVALKFESFMDEFKTVKTGSKFLTNVIMVAATALFMVQIPKLYTLYKTNPETDAFRSNEGEVIRANKK